MNSGAGKKTILITGAGQGIGRGMVSYFLAKGMSVCAVDIDSEALDELALLNRNHEDSLMIVKCDVASESEFKSAIDGATERFGSLKAIINNAVLTKSFGMPLEQLALELWNRELSVNLTAVMLSAKHGAPHLGKAAGGGVILNMASTRAFQSEKNTESYAAAKGGIIALTHALAVSLGPSIRVNSISPGWIEVGDLKKTSCRSIVNLSEADHLQHPAGRVGCYEDIAAMAFYLISNEASFITAQNFTVDGGMTKKMIYV